MRNIAFNMINEGLRLAQAGFKFISVGPAYGGSYLRPDGTSYYKQPGGTDYYLRP